MHTPDAALIQTVTPSLKISAWLFDDGGIVLAEFPA